MRNSMARRWTSRLIAGAIALAFASVLGGCSGFSAPSWDPTDIFDFLDTKKRAPGERKPVFPEGVPGISQGVPREMVRGSAESRAAADAQSATAAPQVIEAQPGAPPAKRTKSASRRPPPAVEQGQVEIAPDDVNVEEEPPPPSPPPPRQAQRRQRTTAPEQQANPFPAPLPR